MTAPEMPWYPAIERAIKPLSGYETAVLVGLALLTLYIAWKGDTVVKTAWLVYLVSP